jgi:hypothetical protein
VRIQTYKLVLNGQITHNISTPNSGLGDQLRTGFSQNTRTLNFIMIKLIRLHRITPTIHTNTEKNKLAAITTGAEVNVQAIGYNLMLMQTIHYKTNQQYSPFTLNILNFHRMVNTFTIPIGAVAINLFIDREPYINFRMESNK